MNYAACDQKTREKVSVLATLWATFAAAFLIVVTVNF